ncbi:GNAT family N-acetyltransferase [Crossiella cryophila]|uniref:Ribosomal protein S18 acetylase RimI-like enzyme n=1 Tax=Crossiella cryophila TaxID=43355 RepID=A0A7W7FVI3_9PSEU|nr:GNAT family N-acetyltransferase [Crossiella cryophila]MBB4679312.1 ribosomal protein S18 acetylase RimI-like enzyme [Crossiella cryophila]
MRLPDGYSLERPSLAEVPEILALVHASDIAAVGFPDFDESEVTATLTAPGFDPATDSWLVRDRERELTGWGYLDSPNDSAGEMFCEAYARPGADPAVQATLITLLLDRIAARTKAAGRSEVIAKAGAVPTEEAYLRVLAAAGFELERQHARMARPLTGTEQPPEPVPGYTLRPLRTEELRDCHEVLRTTFAETAHPLHSTFAEFAATPGIQWADSLAAEADGGGLAGVSVCSNQAVADNEGWIKWLGVLPEHRGRGLASALLRAGFAGYAAEGRTKVGLGVDTTNPTGAYRLYESVGMTAAYRTNIYRQTIRR